MSLRESETTEAISKSMGNGQIAALPFPLLAGIAEINGLRQSPVAFQRANVLQKLIFSMKMILMGIYRIYTRRIHE